MRRLWTLVLLCSLLPAARAYCGKGGHYAPGVSGIRDFIMPQKSGFYAVGYNPYYFSDTFNGRNGGKVQTLAAPQTIYVNQTPISITADTTINIDVQSFGTSLLAFYVFEPKILDAKIGTMIGTYFGYMKAKITADVVPGSGGGIQIPGMGTLQHVTINDSNYGAGDLTVSPLWLNWGGRHHDIWVLYGFYAPVGKYNSQKFVNIGRGFWSHEIAIGGAYYPWMNRATAVICNIGYEVNQRQRDTGVTPGQNLTLEYGFSQYFSSRLEAALSGYSQLQITDDTGINAVSAPRSYVHALGGEGLFWVLPGRLGISARFLYEYAARLRTRGQLATFNLYYIF